MIDWLASLGADLIRSATLFALLFAAIWCGTKAAEITARRHSDTAANIAGWIAGIAAFIALALTFGPTLDQLHRFACRDARDFELCMDPPAPDYP